MDTITLLHQPAVIMMAALCLILGGMFLAEIDHL